jgi:hypothetical protein
MIDVRQIKRSAIARLALFGSILREQFSRDSEGHPAPDSIALPGDR